MVLAAFLISAIYQKCCRNNKVLYLLVVAEVAGLLVLLSNTGGLNSPFIWYILNPLALASAYLPFLFGWLLMGGVLAVSWILGPNFIATDSYYDFFLSDTVVILLIATVGMQILFSLLFSYFELYDRLRLQQDELFSSYISLSENHQTIQALSKYQREIVSLQSEEEIYSRLSSITESVFPFLKAAVLFFSPGVSPATFTLNSPYKVIDTNLAKKGEKFNTAAVIGELRERWNEISLQSKMILGEKKNWLAIPIWSDHDSISGVYIAWIKPGTRLHKIPDTLPLYILFTEQVIQRLANLKQLEHTLQHLSSLYEAAEAITSSSEPKVVIDLFAAYAKTLTGCNKVVFWLENTNWPGAESGERGNFIYTVKGIKDVYTEDLWLNQLLQAWSEIQESHEPVIRSIENYKGKPIGQLICVPVKSSSRCYGVLAALQAKKPYYSMEEIINTLSFLADLSSISIERNNAEIFADKLLVVQEQNRIANELHDSISQNLFNIVYGSDSLGKQIGAIPQPARELLQTIQQVAAETAKEVRLLIYRLSPRKRGDSTFEKEVRSYLEGLGSLNQVSIDFTLKGSEEFLNPATSKAFYRIIKEATGNAVRHGKCNRIKVEMEIGPFVSNQFISDDGVGFNVSVYNNRDQRSRKLGLVNMRELASSLQGTLIVESKAGEGTVINCSIPTYPVSSGTALN